MTPIDIDRLLTTLAGAVDEAQGCLIRQTGRTDILNRLWMVQDNLHRLVEAVSDHRDQTLLRMKVQHPHLSGTISNFVQDVSLSKISSIAAVARSCRSISNSLGTIDSVQTESKMAAALQSVFVS